MKWLVLYMTLLCPLGAALAEECDALAAEIVDREGLAVDRRTTMRVIFTKHPLVSEMSVGCTFRPPDLFMSWDGAYPPTSFYDLLGRVGHIVTGGQAAQVRDGAARCQRAALKSKSELSDLTIAGISFECQAFARGGGGTSITLYRKRPKQVVN
jgi:hypothetical protein